MTIKKEGKSKRKERKKKEKQGRGQTYGSLVGVAGMVAYSPVGHVFGAQTRSDVAVGACTCFSRNGVQLGL